MKTKIDLGRREFLQLMAGTGGMAVLGSAVSPKTSFAKEIYPAGKIAWIVGNPPGGGNDLVARGFSVFLHPW